MYQFVQYGANGLLHSLIGMLIPFVILFGFFWLRVIGAGDVKLFLAIGAYVGGDIRWVLLYACICAGITAIVRLLCISIKDKQQQTELDGRFLTGGYRHKMHLSIPIALGCGIYMAGGWLFGV